jgi:hypothetical protein
MPRRDCPLCRALVPEGSTHCPGCGIRVAALPRLRPDRGGRPPGAAEAARRWRVPPVPQRPAEAVRLGLAGGAALLAAALLAAAVTRLAGGDPVAALGNASLLLGMLAFGAATLAGSLRLTRPAPSPRTRSGGPGSRPPARGGSAWALWRLSAAVAGALPFGLFVALAAR